VFSSRKSSPSQSTALNQPLALEKGRPPKVVSGTLYSLSFLAVGGIAWASLTEIRELTSAPGQIMPIGQVNNVQHLEGGIVAEILVKEGAMVKEGDALIRLAPISASADSDQVKNRSAGLQMTILRLEAQSVGKKPDLSKFAKDYPVLVKQNMALYEADENARVKERDTLNTRIRQRQQEMSTFTGDEAILTKQYAIAMEQFNIQEELMKQGYTSKKVYLDSKASMQKSESDLNGIKGRVLSSKESLKEAEGLLAELNASVARKIADERSKANSEYAEISGQVDKHSDRIDRLMVRATSSGYVQEIMPKIAGEILRPSEVAVRIVPAGQELIAEVRIDPKDIGHIQAGAKVEVKYSTYDPAMYGFSTGIVQKISATTFLPQQTSTPVPGQDGGMTQTPYYKAIVKLDSMHVGEGKFKRPVTTGMIVTADIITGTKSLTRYMLKPVARSLDKAFSER
jgi:membrane fusion protein, adhesin transport system